MTASIGVLSSSLLTESQVLALSRRGLLLHLRDVRGRKLPRTVYLPLTPQGIDVARLIRQSDPDVKVVLYWAEGSPLRLMLTAPPQLGPYIKAERAIMEVLGDQDETKTDTLRVLEHELRSAAQVERPHEIINADNVNQSTGAAYEMTDVFHEDFAFPA